MAQRTRCGQKKRHTESRASLNNDKGWSTVGSCLQQPEHPAKGHLISALATERGPSLRARLHQCQVWLVPTYSLRSWRRHSVCIRTAHSIRTSEPVPKAKTWWEQRVHKALVRVRMKKSLTNCSSQKIILTSRKIPSPIRNRSSSPQRL